MLIATFHSKVQAHMKATSPKTGRPAKERKKKDEDEFRKVDTKGGKGDTKGGKGDVKGGKGDSKGGGKDAKGGGKGDSKGGGKGNSQLLEHLRSQPASWFTEIRPDGHQRALCESFIIDGKCSHGTDCIFGQHGGHPANPTAEQKRVCQERKVNRAKAQKEYREKNRLRREYAAQKRRLDAEEE